MVSLMFVGIIFVVDSMTIPVSRIRIFVDNDPILKYHKLLEIELQ